MADRVTDSPAPLDVEAAPDEKVLGVDAVVIIVNQAKRRAYEAWRAEKDTKAIAQEQDRYDSLFASHEALRAALASSLSGIAELRRMAATFAAELGHVPDPRLRVESVPIERITRKTSTFQGIPRVLTNVEVDAILAALAARLASDSGTEEGAHD